MAEFPTYTKKNYHDVHPAIDASRPELSAKGKRVVISGGAGGIGAATAEAFARAGAAEIVILGRTRSTLDAAKKKIESVGKGSKVTVVVADVSKPENIEKLMEQLAQGAPVDIFINNAAYNSDVEPIKAMNKDDWWKTIDVNIRGSLEMTTGILNIATPDAVIVNVSSGIAHIPAIPGLSAYGVSKIATTKFFESVQAENPELRVFNIQPGVIQSTAMAAKALKQTGQLYPLQDTVELPGNFVSFP
jgi:NAD(P)-dependent dehydrogenase (short-subunit alcohol dehydrogenase family)